MKHYICIIIATVLCLAMTGCGKEAPTEERIQYLRLENSSVSAVAVGGDYSVKIITNTSCKVSTGTIDWIQIKDDNFVGNKDLVLKIMENTGNARNGVIVISTLDGSISCELAVNQSSK